MLVFHNFLVLFWKNVLLYWRHKGVLLLHLCCSLIAMLVIKYVSQVPIRMQGAQHNYDSSNAAKTNVSLISERRSADNHSQWVPAYAKMSERTGDSVRYFPRNKWTEKLMESNDHAFNGFQPNLDEAVASIKTNSNITMLPPTPVIMCDASLTDEATWSWICNNTDDAFPNSSLAVLFPQVSGIPSQLCYSIIFCDPQSSQDKSKRKINLHEPQKESVEEMIAKVQYMVNMAYVKSMLDFR
jgi:hypothetical protein